MSTAIDEHFPIVREWALLQMLLFDFLKSALQERHWTIPKFARECDVSIQLAYKWLAEDESARITPSPGSCEKIARTLGYDADYVLELAGHRKPREPRAEVDARRQARREQLERWVDAVGPEYEDVFWDDLKNRAESNVRFIDQVKTAVSAEQDAAVSAAISARATRGRKPRGSGGGPLAKSQHTLARALNHRPAVTNERCAA